VQPLIKLKISSDKGELELKDKKSPLTKIEGIVPLVTTT
jgi:hypothetical protein